MNFEGTHAIKEFKRKNEKEQNWNDDSCPF